MVNDFEITEEIIRKIFDAGKIIEISIREALVFVRIEKERFKMDWKTDRFNMIYCVGINYDKVELHLNINAIKEYIEGGFLE